MGKVVILVALVAFVIAVSGGNLSNNEYVDGEYMIRIDEAKFNTKADVQEFIEHLEGLFKVYVIESYKIGNVRLLYVKGDHEDVMKAEKLSGIKYIERNNVFHVAQCSATAQPGCWGLDRTDQREILDYIETDSPDATYIYGDHMGTSSVVYLADSGIDTEHEDFGTRVQWGFTAGSIPTYGDGNGHGTHCAGIIGSDSYGIAKTVQLIAVKVIRDNGISFTSAIVGGLEYILEDHNLRTDHFGVMAKSVASLTNDGGISDAYDDAAQALVEAGVIVVAAAGNGDMNACDRSPGRVPDVINVGAVDITDTSADFTNFGTCVDIFAPGVAILSTKPDQDNDEGTTGVETGTSMAAAFVTGVVARYQDSLTAAPSPAEVNTNTRPKKYTLQNVPPAISQRSKSK